MDAAPQLGGLFAGGMPKLRKTGGGVATGGTYTLALSAVFSLSIGGYFR